MGDVIHALPVVGALRRSYPAARIDWIIESRWQELIELHPGLTNIIPIDTRAWRRSPLAWGTMSEMTNCIRDLRRARYDMALDLQGLYKSAAISRVSGARRRIGFDVHSLREPGAAMFYTEQAGVAALRHVVDRNIALARAAGAAAPASLAFDLPVSSDAEANVQRQLEARDVQGFFVISPGGGWGAKRWPVDRYAELARRLCADRGGHCFLNTGPEESELTAEFERCARGIPWVRFALSVRELAALLKRARLVVAGDSGPLHMAAALDTPLVGLYGPTDPARNGPYGNGHSPAKVIHHSEMGIRTYRRDAEVSPAMLAITVDEAVAAASDVLENAGG